jgi:asparagine synthase (glutamine-hydrolysing)
MQKTATSKVKTYTIGFEDKAFNEAPFAKKVAEHLGTDHHELYVSSEDAMNVIGLLPKMYDEPFADSSQIPTFLVSQAAKRDVTVALSGDAGDELLGGYNRYLWGSRVWSKISWLPFEFRKFLGHAVETLPTHAWDLLSQGRIARLGDKAHKMAQRLKSVRSHEDLYQSLVSEWDQPERIVKNWQSLDSLHPLTSLEGGVNLGLVPDEREFMMLMDMYSYLPDDILCKVDRAAMAVSLETRIPFLDHRVVEFAWNLPMDLKIRQGQGKWILRQILYKYVPRELIERPKAGFGIPLGSWLRGPLKEWAQSLLEPTRIEKEGYFYSAPIANIWQEHLSGQRDWSGRLWTILMFQAWLADN